MIRLDRILCVRHRAFLDQTQDQGVFLFAREPIFVYGFLVRKFTPSAGELGETIADVLARNMHQQGRRTDPLAATLGRDLPKLEITLVEKAVAGIDFYEDIGTP